MNWYFLLPGDITHSAEWRNRSSGTGELSAETVGEVIWWAILVVTIAGLSVPVSVGYDGTERFVNRQLISIYTQTIHVGITIRKESSLKINELLKVYINTVSVNISVY
jgi:hypothetical protein